eukprot:8818776-Alexandrium_andersonii.AAC.1
MQQAAGRPLSQAALQTIGGTVFAAHDIRVGAPVGPEAADPAPPAAPSVGRPFRLEYIADGRTGLNAI